MLGMIILNENVTQCILIMSHRYVDFNCEVILWFFVRCILDKSYIAHQMRSSIFK